VGQFVQSLFIVGDSVHNGSMSTMEPSFDERFASECTQRVPNHALLYSPGFAAGAQSNSFLDLASEIYQWDVLMHSSLAGRV